MEPREFINKLVNMFRFWILTTDLRSMNVYEAFLDVTDNNYNAKDICDAINITISWADTEIGYDVCSEAQLEWSVISLITFFRLNESGEFEGLSTQEMVDIEYSLQLVFTSSMNKFKRYTKLWDKRKQQKSAHLIMVMLESYMPSDGNDTFLSAQIRKVLTEYKYN